MKNAQRMHTLIVGIDDYLPPPEAEGPVYGKLFGCAADATRVASLLIDVGVPVDRVRLLTAPQATASTGWPTYDRLVQELSDLGERAEPGDAVWIHYSGHGGRTPTVFPELKGHDAFDEALVPPDIADPESQYLRDVELVFLLERLIRRGLFVTLVLDCCHAGGLLRDSPQGTPGVPQARPRSNRVQDWRRPRPSSVASAEQLAACWRRFGVPWRLPRARGYVLLAACRQHELAWEYTVSPGERGGALTQALLETLQGDGSRMSYRGFYERILGRVRTRFDGFQTPRLEGEGDRQLFGGDIALSAQGVTVLVVKPESVLLATGQSQGVAVGDRFALEPLTHQEDTEVVDIEPPVAELTDVGGAESWARWIRRGTRPMLAGDRALPACLIASRHAVMLDESLGTFGERLRTLDCPFLTWERVPPAAFRLERVEEDLKIARGDGRRLTHALPRLRLADTEPAVATRWLERLARYRTVEQIVPHSVDSPLTAALDVRLGRLPRSFRPRIDVVEPSADLGGATSVDVATWLALTIESRWRQPLEVAVLDLDPSWCITQLYPSPNSFLTLDPGGQICLPLQTQPPAGKHQLKIFATLDAVRWHWLELPPGRLPGPPRDRPRTPTEALLARLLHPRAEASNLRTSGAEWTVRDLMIRIEPCEQDSDQETAPWPSSPTFTNVPSAAHLG